MTKESMSPGSSGSENLLPYKITDHEQKIAELIQKRIWGQVNPVRARITDGIKEPISGHIQMMAESLRLGGTAVILADMLNNHLPAMLHVNSEAELMNALTTLASHTALAYLINNYPFIYNYLLENYRLHPSSKLGLEAKPITPDGIQDDMRFCIDRMNENFEGIEDQEIDAEVVIDNVYKFMDGLYGLHTPATRKAKSPTRLAKLPYGSSGYFDTISGEIIAVNPDNPLLVTHEALHSQGLRRESETEMATIVSLITSEYPKLRYFGYSRWLNRLTQLMAIDENKENIPDLNGDYYQELSERLRSMGLKDGCIEFENDLRKEEEHLASIDRSSNLGKKLRKFEMQMMNAADRAMGGRISRNHLRKYAAIGRTTNYWYNLLPISLLHDYRSKYLTS